MDPYARAAFGRIRVFLDDLNFVLGCLPAVQPIRPLDGQNRPFDQSGPQPPFCPNFSNMTVGRGHPTRRSKSWRKKHSQPVSHQPRQPSHAPVPVCPIKQHSACRVNTIPNHETQPAIPLDVQPNNQAAPFFSPNSVPIQLDAHDSTYQCLSDYHKCLNDDAADPSGPHLLANEHDPKDKQDPHPLENKHDPKDQQDPHLLENEHDTKEQYNPHLLEDKQGPNDSPV
jgi:hypothetical protein